MKIVKFSIVIVAACLMFTGCDFVRSLVGKPTSADLDRIRNEQQMKAAVAESDTCDESSVMPDSVMTIVSEVEPANDTDKKGGDNNVEFGKLERKYYIAMGVFSLESNVTNLVKNLNLVGYDAEVVLLDTGMMMVVTGGSDSLSGLEDVMTELKQFSFCPPDIRIIKSEKYNKQ